MLGITARDEIVSERGPRYAITGTIRGGEFAATYALTSEAAEKVFEDFQERGYRNVKVHVPIINGFDVDLTALGHSRSEALREAASRTQVLRAAVLRAAELGRAEAEIARAAGIDRMTVRSWLGK